MKVLITGITGTLGTQLANLLLEDGHEVIGYSRDELKQQLFFKHEALTLYLGDVRDKDRLVEASRYVDVIFHLAALKHVDKLEENPEESVATNILGTENVLHAQRVNDIPKVVFSSTDKACSPINTYGMSKAIAERLVLRNPSNVVCRYGNVLGSRGSVLPKFVSQLRSTGTIEITDKRMTRFWIPAHDAANFVFFASRKDGGLFIPPMKAYPVLKLALLVGKLLHAYPKHIVDIGIRPGEKLHEQLRRDVEGGEVFSSDTTHWFNEKELSTLLTPILESLS